MQHTLVLLAACPEGNLNTALDGDPDPPYYDLPSSSSLNRRISDR